MKSFFVFDVESVGLHGEGFAVGGGVFLENGAAQSEFRYSCPISEAKGADSDREWVKANIPVLEITHHIPSRVREMFWMEWLNAKENYPEIIMAAECGWPVEARFLCACVDDSRESRNWTGPYPLLEISSVMMAAEMNPMDKYPRTESEPEHDPLGDARLSARLLSEALTKLELQNQFFESFKETPST